MTAGTDACEISKGEIDVVGGADCNGSTKIITDANVNVSGDSDSSYDFVDEVTADPVETSVHDDDDDVANNCNNSHLTTNDVEIQNGGGVDCCLAESDCIVVGKSNGGEVVVDDGVESGDGDVVAKGEVNGNTVLEVVVESVPVDCQVTSDEVVELESSPKVVESEESREAVIEVNEAREPVVEASEAEPVFEVEEVSELIIEAFKAVSVVEEAQEVREPVVETFEAASVVEAKEVGEPVIETFEAASVVEAQEVGDPVIKTFEAASAIEVQEVGEPVVEQSEAESVVETQGVKEPVVGTSEAGGAMTMPEAESNLELVESQTSEKNVILEGDGSELAEVEKVGEVKSEEQPGLISNGEVDESEDSHLTGRGVAEYEKELEEENNAEVDNQESPVLFTSEVQCDLRTENEASDLTVHGTSPLETEAAGGSALNDDQASRNEQVDRSIDESQTGTQQSEDFEDDQVLPSTARVPLEAETVVDPACHEDQVSKPEDVSKHILENQKYTHLNVGSETENESEVPPEAESASEPTPSENQASQVKEVSECIDESQNDTQMNKVLEVDQTLPSAIYERSETVNETEVPLETSDSKLVSNEKVQNFPSSDCVGSESNNGDMAVGDNDSRILDKEVGDGAFPITENVPTFSSDYSNQGADIERDDKNSEDGLCCAPNVAKSEIEVENGAVGGDMSGHLEKRASSEIGIEFGSIGHRQKPSSLWCDDVEPEVPNGDTEPTNDSASGYLVNDSHQNENLPVLESGFEAEHSSAISSTDLPSNGAVNPTSEILAGSVGGMENVLNSSEKVEDELSGDVSTCDKATVIDGVQSDGVPTTLPESSISDATDGQDVDTEVITKPFYFLIKIPRFEDEKLSEKIRHAQLLVDEKTQQRDAIKAEMHKKRANCQAYGQRFEAAKTEERTARRSVKSKRQEIDSLQSVISRVKNAISVDEIDKRIYGMEHMIQHETLPLKEEKEFIREIKRLKHLREQLSSNMGSQDEVQQALEQKDENEDHLKKLKKELENLKNTVLKAEAVKISAGKKYDEESKRLKELQAQMNAANEIRQEAYGNWLMLRGQLNDKRKNFHVYKDDAKAAFDYASCGDKEALHRLCVDQVDQLMGLWNTDDEFRKEYVRCNIRSTVRRLRTLDGRSLGPDEEPPVLPAYVDERVGRRLISVPSQAKSISGVANVEQEKQVSSAEEKQADEKSIEEVAEPKIQIVKTRETAKPIVLSGSATVSGRDDKVEEDRNEQKEEIPTKEEQELATKAEELRKAEIEAKLKEQRRLEEKAKAKEALERKKRNLEKAQMRAELRAQKEAEEKEKEKEKRLRKKEKRKSGPGGDVVHEHNSNGEDAAITTIAKESEVKESNSNSNGVATTSKKPPPQKAWFVKQQSSKPKPIPPPLRNRGKKRMQQWLWMISVAAIVLILFLLGNTGFFLNLRQRKAAGGNF